MPAGSFTMGSPASEKERSSDEGPQHRVTFATAVRGRQVRGDVRRMGRLRCGRRLQRLPARDQGWGRGKRPVINVTLGRCQGLCGVAVAQDRQDLSPAERGGAGIRDARRHDDAVLVGLDDLDQPGQLQWELHLWRRVEGRVSAEDDAGRFVPANPWGLYQVHGNVWEWTEDCWNGSYSGAPTVGHAWHRSSAPSRRPWASSAYVRAAVRIAQSSVRSNASYFASPERLHLERTNDEAAAARRSGAGEFEIIMVDGGDTAWSRADPLRSTPMRKLAREREQSWLRLGARAAPRR